MRQLVIFLSFVVLVFGMVCDQVDESRNAMFNQREAKLVSIDADNRAVLEDHNGRKLEAKIVGYKVGDTVPIWSAVTDESEILQRDSEAMFEPSVIPWICYVLAGLLFVASFFLSVLPQEMDLTEKDSLTMTHVKEVK